MPLTRISNTIILYIYTKFIYFESFHNIIAYTICIYKYNNNSVQTPHHCHHYLFIRTYKYM